MTKATIDDVAQLAGVSIKTVSRVVNREPNVRDSTQDKVAKAIQTLNYRPNQSARSLASRRSYLIGLLYDDPGAYEIPSSGYVIMLQQGVLTACRAANYELLIHPCNYRDKNAGAGIKALIEHSRLDGIVLAPPLSNMPGIMRAIQETATPVVGIAPGPDDHRELTVATNDRAACAEMTEYLASQGHRRIAYVTGHPDHKAVSDRYNGYRDGLRNSELEFASSLVVSGDNSIHSGELCAGELMKLDQPPTAIFAANDDMAAGVIRTLHRMGMSVPADVSVAGFDDIPLAQQIFPSLTTVRQPLQEMAEQATVSLIDVLRTKPAFEPERILPASLVIRESTGPAPA